MAKILRIKLVKGVIGFNKRQKATVRALGLQKREQVVEKADSPAIRGMINAVSHLIEVTEK